jgi:hypothetical protein
MGTAFIIDRFIEDDSFAHENCFQREYELDAVAFCSDILGEERHHAKLEGIFWSRLFTTEGKNLYGLVKDAPPRLVYRLVSVIAKGSQSIVHEALEVGTVSFSFYVPRYLDV